MRLPKPEKRKSRLSDRELEWSCQVKKRDGYCCERCGKYDLNNHAHHIAPRGRAPERKFDLSNGVTLCWKCHHFVHLHPREAEAAGLLAKGK